MKTPYLKVVDQPRVMSGKGAPKPTIFGVIGKTKYEPENRVLGGLVKSTVDRMPMKVSHSAKGMHSDRGASTGKKSATCIPGQHYGMVPYQGKFMSQLGGRL